MSNPAVIKLKSGRIKNSKVWLDDNFGESIHIHIDDHRVDLTVNEFEQLYDDLCKVMNGLFQIDGLDFSTIDPVFLECFLWRILPTISHIKYDNVHLEDLWAPFDGRKFKLKDSVGVKALKGISDENEGFRNSHHLGQTDQQRLNACLESIRENGYPFQNKYIILLGDVNLIYDGQHRASCLYYLHGNIEVPVIRIYSNYYDIKEPKERDNWKIVILFEKVCNRLKTYCTYFMKFINTVAKVLGKIGRRIHSIMIRNRKPIINKEAVILFNAK